MSGEQITAKELNNNRVFDKKNSKNKKVNINDLLSRIRQEKNREKKENYIFLGLVCGLVTLTGIIASL